MNLTQQFRKDYLKLSGIKGSKCLAPSASSIDFRIESVWTKLTMAYVCSPGRHYHTGQHIAEALEAARELMPGTRHQAVVRTAILFHDAVYDPNNRRPVASERASADLASELLVDVLASNMALIRSAILATAHLAGGGHQKLNAINRIVISADLAILAAEPKRFRQYCDQIRREYELVPVAVYAQRRADILKMFLEKRPLFPYPKAEALWGDRARRNLRREIERLKREFE